MYHSILVPLDGSVFGEQALPFALAIARSVDGHIHLAHVGQARQSPPTPAHRATDLSPVIKAPLSEDAYLDKAARRLRSVWDGMISTTLLSGPTALALYDHAVECMADIIVLATHGRGPLSRFWLGSVADTLMRWAPMPVLLVRPHEQPPDLAHAPTLKHLLLPLDGSSLAEQMLGPALALGGLMGARYTLLQVVEPLVIESVGQEQQGPEQVEAHAWAYLEDLANHLRMAEIDVDTDVIVAEHPAPAILDYAQRHAADLIALKTHGRGGLNRMLLGSVADKVLHGSRVPLLLQHPGSDEAAEQ
jgi:nucleotide-binding universal stress UspA family protein